MTTDVTTARQVATLHKTELFVVVMAHALAFYLAVGLLAIGVTAVYVFGPTAETFVSPVLRFGPTVELLRDARKACFTLNLSKVSAAIPLKYVFFVEQKLSERIPVAAYLVDERGRKASQDLLTHRVGESWRRRYCFEMPATVSDDMEIRITGHAIHRRHPLWKTITEVPPFIIPAVKG